MTMPTVAIDAREARAERPRGRGRYARELIAAQRRLGVYEVREEVGGMGPEVLWEQVAWPRRLARHPADLVHAPSGLLPLRRPCPGLVSVHDLAFEAHDDLPPRAAWRHRTFVPRSVRSAELTLCGSAFTAADVAERYDVDPDRLRVVPYAPALEHGDAPLPDGAPYLLAVGDQRPSRNLERLVAAFAALRAGELPDHRLVLAGAGPASRRRRRGGHRLAGRRAARRAHARGRGGRAPEPLRRRRARRARGDGARRPGGRRRGRRAARDVRRRRRALRPPRPRRDRRRRPARAGAPRRAGRRGPRARRALHLGRDRRGDGARLSRVALSRPSG